MAVAVQAFNPSPREVEAGSSEFQDSQHLPGRTQVRETLSQKNKKEMLTAQAGEAVSSLL